MKALDDAPFVDVFSGEFNEDPARFVDPLRSKTGVVRTPIGGLVIRRDLVQGLLTDRRLRSSIRDLVVMQGVTEGLIFDLLSNSLLASEGDEHLRLRRLVNRAFTPRAVDPHRPVMRDILGSLLAPVVSRGECEFMAEVADHYPILVMCHLLGVPDEDHGNFATWNKAVTWVLSFELGSHRDEAEWGMSQLDGYVGRLIEDRRRDPREDMVTALVQAEDEGDRLSDWELRAMIGGLLFAGFDTTRNQLGLAMALFAEHPDHWSLLAEHSELAPRAVEEVMRFRGATSVAPRIAAEDLDVDGYHVPAGTFLALGTSTANFDPAAYDDPATFDITAEREPQLTFGGGPHYCLGANLARAEMQEALALLSVQMPELALDGEPTWRTPMGIFGPETLPLRFAAATT
jgi:cytochrome P450